MALIGEAAHEIDKLIRRVVTNFHGNTDERSALLERRSANVHGRIRAVNFHFECVKREN